MSAAGGVLTAWRRRLRVTQWAHFLPLPVAGLSGVGWEPGWLLGALRGVLAAGAVLAWGYLLNAVHDREMDVDPEKNPLTRELPHPRRGVLAALGVGALALSAVSPWALLAAGVSLLSGWSYSAGPRLKSRPFVGTALNVTCFAPLLFLAARSWTEVRAALPLALAFSGLLVQNQLLHESADLDEDLRGGLRTTFAALGARGSAAVALACALITVLAARRVSDHAALVAGVALGSLLAPWALREGWSPARARRAHRGVAALIGAGIYLSSLTVRG